MPDMLNWFGWCTWDAFYTDVTSEGIKKGLERLLAFNSHPKSCFDFTNLTLQLKKIELLFPPSFFFFSFQKGGISPKFVIIDDGWQSVAMDPTGIDCKSDNAAK